MLGCLVGLLQEGSYEPEAFAARMVKLVKEGAHASALIRYLLASEGFKTYAWAAQLCGQKHHTINGEASSSRNPPVICKRTGMFRKGLARPKVILPTETRCQAGAFAEGPNEP